MHVQEVTIGSDMRKSWLQMKEGLVSLCRCSVRDPVACEMLHQTSAQHVGECSYLSKTNETLVVPSSRMSDTP